MEEKDVKFGTKLSEKPWEVSDLHLRLIVSHDCKKNTAKQPHHIELSCCNLDFEIVSNRSGDSILD